MPASNSPISLLVFTRAIANHINSNPDLREQWVVAELSDFRMHGPHAYGQLIEKDATGKTVARIQATIWANSLYQIRNKFIRATQRDIATGMKLMLKLTASHAPAYGLSANITDIDPAYTLGDMERLRREILEQLRREGVFDRNHELTLSQAPQRIAVISAEGAAGYGDFINQLSTSGFAFYPVLFMANMQGDRTVPTILAALDRIEITEDAWDAVVIIRGGGATSDLNSFDNLELARRIATFPIPVIVGIGHERDNTVLDAIANIRCKTPTAVAAFLTNRLAEAEIRAEDLMRLIADHTRNVLASEQQHIAHLTAILPALAPARLQTEAHRIDRLNALVNRTATSGVSRAQIKLSELATRLAQTSTATISRQQARLSTLPDILSRLTSQRTVIEHNRLNSIAKLIEVLSPEATLRRGYSITRVDGKAISSANAIPPGTLLVTTLSDGILSSTSLP